MLAACCALIAHPDDERYQHLFGTTVTTPLYGVEVPVLAHSAAEMDKGAGIAMCCTFGDLTDVAWWRELQLPTRTIIGRDGRILSETPQWIIDAGSAEKYETIAGKTTFTQGIAQGMQVKGRITSPTFVIARVHRSRVGGPDLVHVDAYRLLDEGGANSGDPLGELDALDLDTELADAVVVAEWGGGLIEQIADKYLFVSIDREPAEFAGADEDVRRISWSWRHND